MIFFFFSCWRNLRLYLLRLDMRASRLMFHARYPRYRSVSETVRQGALGARRETYAVSRPRLVFVFEVSIWTSEVLLVRRLIFPSPEEDILVQPVSEAAVCSTNDCLQSSP